MNTSKKKQGVAEKISKWNSYFFLGLITVYVLGVRNFEIPVGIDPSYEWIVTNSTETGKIFRGEFLGTYGPLGFLDFNYTRVLPLRALAIMWAVTCYALFFKEFWTTLVERKFFSSKLLAGLFTFVVILITERFMTTSLLFVFWLFLIRKKQLSSRSTWALSIIVALLFYVKLLPFVIGVVVLIFRFAIGPSSQDKPSSNLNHQYLKLLTPFFITLSIAALNDGTRVWLRGFFESLIGYSAMSGHPKNSYFVLLLYILVCALVLTITDASFAEKSLIFIVLLVLLGYGFQRQDQGHLLPAFFFLLILPLTCNMQQIFRTKSRFLNFGILLMLLVILLISPRAAGPGFVKWDLAFVLIFGGFLILLSASKSNSIVFVSAFMIFVMVTAQSPFIVVRELFSRFPSSMQLSSRIQDSETALTEIFTGDFPKSVATAADLALQASLKDYSGVVIANRDVYGPLGSLNVDHLPVPMLFGAFSPWLDNQNVNYLKSRKLDYVFLEKNTAIDGNFWTTEAPATALYLFCNFAPASNSDTWLLLYKLPANRCKNSSNATTQIIDEQNITLVDIETRFVLPGQHLFTDSDSYVLDIQGRRVGIQPKNSSGIMVHVPHSLDYPEPWNINGNLDLGRSERFNYRVLRLK